VLAYDGHVELDAAIMDGSDRRCGAVAGLKSTRAPISAARAVMEQSPHVLMSYEGADDFACEAGLEQVPNRWFVTPERRRQLDELLAKGSGAFDADIKYGTIGAVAVDLAGHVEAATSTGGLTAKRWGRIGDSPLIGAGTYADDRAAAVSATGLGEVFIRAAAAHELCARVRMTGADLQEALDGVLEEVRTLGGNGGLIAVSPSGEAAWGFTTPGMYRGLAGPEGRQVAIYGEESER
jgi:beta-aspartyl-peptidase (threonine type)